MVCHSWQVHIRIQVHDTKWLHQSMYFRATQLKLPRAAVSTGIFAQTMHYTTPPDFTHSFYLPGSGRKLVSDDRGSSARLVANALWTLQPSGPGAGAEQLWWCTVMSAFQQSQAGEPVSRGCHPHTEVRAREGFCTHPRQPNTRSSCTRTLGVIRDARVIQTEAPDGGGGKRRRILRRELHHAACDRRRATSEARQSDISFQTFHFPESNRNEKKKFCRIKFRNSHARCCIEFHGAKQWQYKTSP